MNLLTTGCFLDHRCSFIVESIEFIAQCQTFDRLVLRQESAALYSVHLVTSAVARKGDSGILCLSGYLL